MLRRDIDRDVTTTTHQSRDLKAGFLEYLPVDLSGDAALFRHGKKVGWAQQPSCGMLPAQQCLPADHVCIAQAHDSLEIGFEFRTCQAVTQLAFQIEQTQSFLMQMLVEYFEAMSPVCLGPIHRHVGIAQQFFGVEVALIAESDADAGRRIELFAREAHRLAQCVEYALSRMIGVLRTMDIFQQEGELVTAQARDDIGFPYAGGDPLTGQLEQLIANQVANAVVDDLEAVKVEE